MSIFVASDTPVSDFWCRLLWVSSHNGKPYSHFGGGVCDIRTVTFKTKVFGSNSKN